MNDTILDEEEPDLSSLEIDDEEPIPEVEEDDYPFVASFDEKLRCFIVQYMGDSDLVPSAHIENLEATYQWIKNGAPEKPKRPRVVKGD